MEAIVVEDKSWMFFETTMRVDALSKMRNLKLLMFPRYEEELSTDEEKEEKFSGNLNYLSNELGYLI